MKTVNNMLDDRIECQICHKKFKMLSSHLKKHRITPSAYLDEYPNSVLVCFTTRNKMSATHKKNWQELGCKKINEKKPEPSDKIQCLLCGKWYSSLSSHMLTHTISLDDYKSQFPGAPTISESVGEAFSRHFKKLWTDENYRRKQAKIRSEANKRNWQKQEYRKARTKESAERFTSKEFIDAHRESHRLRAKKLWENEEYRKVVTERCSVGMRRAWATKPAKLLEAVKRNSFGTPTKHDSPKAGKFTTRSKLEAAFARQLDEDDNIISYNYESTRIPYVYKCKQRTYIIDFTTTTADGEIQHLEVKPKNYTPDEKTLSKWEAAKNKLTKFSVIEFSGG